MAKRKSTRSHGRVRKLVKFARGTASAINSGRSIISRVLSRKKVSSRTKTKSKKKSNTVVQMGTGVWKSACRWGKYHKRAPKHIVANSPKVNYIDQGAFRLESSAGRQGVGGTGLNLFSPADLATLSGVTSDLSSTKQWHIKGGSLKVMGTNSSNANIKVTFYNIYARRNLGIEHWPITDWNEGYADQGGTIGVNQNYVGASPYDVSRFTQNWGIWKTTVFRLGQGESLEYTIDINVNKVMNGVQLWDIVNETSPSQSIGAYKGLTQYLVCVVSGYPAHNAGAEASVSVPQVAFDCTYTKKWQFWNMQELSRQTNTLSTYSTAFAGTQMNIDTAIQTLITN